MEPCGGVRGRVRRGSHTVQYVGAEEDTGRIGMERAHGDVQSQDRDRVVSVGYDGSEEGENRDS